MGDILRFYAATYREGLPMLAVFALVLVYAVFLEALA